MTHRLIAAALALAATPALADLTAEDVLADQLNLLSGYGVFDVVAQGRTDTASGLKVESFVGTFEGDTETVTLTIGGVELIEQPDGSVRVIYPASLPISLVVEQANGDVVTTGTAIELTDPAHTISGDANTMHHVFSVTALAINELTVDPVEELEMVDFSFAYALQGLEGEVNLDRGAIEKRDLAFDIGQMKLVTYFKVPQEAVTPGSDRQPGVFDADMTFNDVSARIGYEGTEVPRHDLSMTIAGVDWSQLIDVPEDDTRANLSLSGADFELSYNIAMSIAAMETDYIAALRSGQGASASFAAGDVAYDFDVDTPEGPVRAQVESARTEARLGFAADGVSYAGGGADMSVTLSGNFPEFPLSSFGYALDAAEFELAIPILPSDAPQSFAVKYLIHGLSMPGELWSLFDPAGEIPRDPLNLEIDLDGTTVIAGDLFDTTAEMPFSRTRGRLNSLKLSVAGVDFDANGHANDLGTPEEPKGEGVLNFTLTGANRLMDTLIAMGLLPEDQAMGARMGLALFARPAGDDVLTSTIEFTEDGSVTANGQRIK